MSLDLWTDLEHRVSQRTGLSVRSISAVFEKPSHDHDHDDHDEDHDDNDNDNDDDDSDEDEDMPSTTLIGTSFTARESTFGRVS